MIEKIQKYRKCPEQEAHIQLVDFVLAFTTIGAGHKFVIYLMKTPWHFVQSIDAIDNMKISINCIALCEMK